MTSRRRDCLIFLNGAYARRDLEWYGSLCRGRFTVAADGGSRFFALAHRRPDLIIGDQDSLAKARLRVTRRTEVVVHPPAKDKTDAQLALEHCLRLRPRRIDLVQPSVGEPDHFLANLLLLWRYHTRARAAGVQTLRVINRRYECVLVKNGSMMIGNRGGDTLSILPLSVLTLSLTGCRFPATSLRLLPGDPMAARNAIIASRARVAVRGVALIIISSSQRK